MKRNKKLYDILGVSPDADEKEIKKTFRDRSKKEHPDTGGDAKSFSELVRAYNVLKDPFRRLNYDEFGAETVQDTISCLGMFGDRLMDPSQGKWYIHKGHGFLISAVSEMGDRIKSLKSSKLVSESWLGKIQKSGNEVPSVLIVINNRLAQLDASITEMTNSKNLAEKLEAEFRIAVTVIGPMDREPVAPNVYTTSNNFWK